MSMANLSKLILTATGILLSMLLVSCSIQKRALRPGFHVERIGALNKKPSLQVQAQETANLPVLPNESVGLSFTPPAAETFAEVAENLDKLEDWAGLAAVTPPQSIESGSLQRELNPMRSDSTGTNPVEGQVSSLDEAELVAKIAEAEKKLKTYTNLLLWTSPLILTIPVYMLLRGKTKSQITSLQTEANLPYDNLAWYNTAWFLIALLLYPILPFALACRLIDQRRMKNGKEPLSWKSKTNFFMFPVYCLILLFLLMGGMTFNLNLAF